MKEKLSQQWKELHSVFHIELREKPKEWQKERVYTDGRNILIIKKKENVNNFLHEALKHEYWVNNLVYENIEDVLNKELYNNMGELILQRSVKYKNIPKELCQLIVPSLSYELLVLDDKGMIIIEEVIEAVLKATNYENALKKNLEEFMKGVQTHWKK